MRRSSDPDVSLASAIASARQILSMRFQRGRVQFSVDHLRDSLAENGSFVNSVISALLADGSIEEQTSEVALGVPAGLFGLSTASYRICPRIMHVIAKTHLGLTFDEPRMTIQRSDFCRHVVTLSPIQMKLALAICDAGEVGIMASTATSLRGGEKTGERQFRTAFNKCLSILGVKLERFAWRIIEK